MAKSVQRKPISRAVALFFGVCWRLLVFGANSAQLSVFVFVVLCDAFFLAAVVGNFFRFVRAPGSIVVVVGCLLSNGL